MTYETMRTDMQEIIKAHGMQGHLIRQTKTTGSMGDTSDVGGSGYTIFFIMQDITKKDRQIHEMGLAIPGNAKAFFYHQYPDSITGNGALIIRAGDMIKDKNDKWWRIEKILGGRKAQTKEIFRVGVIKNIGLDS